MSFLSVSECTFLFLLTQNATMHVSMPAGQKNETAASDMQFISDVMTFTG